MKPRICSECGKRLSRREKRVGMCSSCNDKASADNRYSLRQKNENHVRYVCLHKQYSSQWYLKETGESIPRQKNVNWLK